MRIGMISPYSLTVPGGVQGQILGLARALRERGESVRVLGPCDGPPPEAFVTPLGNCVPTGANGSVVPLAPDPAAQLRTIRALRDEEFDVLHLHEPLAPGPTMTALLVSSVPMIGTFHRAGASLAYDIFKPLTMRGARRLDVRFAVSTDAEELAISALGGVYEPAFNAVEVSKFRTAQPQKTDGPTILFLSRHEQRKGLAVLLEAFSALSADTRLWIGGVGPETAELQSRYAGDPRISWLGRISEEEKVARMVGADLFCAPSLHGESFGIVLLEAMASQTAVVASNIDGYAKVTGDGEFGSLFDTGNVEALITQLERLLSNPHERDRLVEKGGERVAQFSMHKLADLYFTAYERVLGL